MTNVVLSKLSANRKSIAFQALFVVVMLAIARFLWIRTQPECLTNMNLPTRGYTVSGDDLYMFVPQGAVDQSVDFLKVRSLHDGRERVIGKVDARYEVLGQYGRRIGGGNLTYVVGARNRIVFGNPGTPAVGASPTYRVQFLGTFLPSQKSLPGTGAIGHKPKRIAHPFLHADIRLQQVSLQGGMPRDVMTFQDYNHVCLAGDHVVWIRPGPDERVEVTREESSRTRTAWTEVTAHSDLMLTSLTDGTTRCLRHGISRTTSMVAGQAGVALTEPAPFPEPPRLSYIRASDGSVHSLGTAVQEEGSQSFVEAGNRLYWTTLTSVSVRNAAPHYRLLCVSLDGTDIHEVCAQRDRRPIDHLALYAYRGSLYCTLAQTSTIGTGDHLGIYAFSEQYLCRLHPEQSDPFEILYKLPTQSYRGGAWFDGGYLYFVRDEAQRSLWARLTNDDAQASYTHMLCRFPLEH
jgi:hypothetical protein